MTAAREYLNVYLAAEIKAGYGAVLPALCGFK
jgi:hypothetical protein